MINPRFIPTYINFDRTMLHISSYLADFDFIMLHISSYLADFDFIMQLSILGLIECEGVLGLYEWHDIAWYGSKRI